MKHLLVAIILAFGLTLPARPASATELLIHFEKPERGQSPVFLDRVELLLIAHNDTERIPLKPERDPSNERMFMYRVPLDFEWLAKQWGNAQHMEGAYIYLESKGDEVSIRSRPFLFMLPLPPYLREQRRSSIDIDFGQGQQATIHDGETQDIVLRFRKPQSRALRFVDDFNRPVTDIAVSAYMFWSAANHCGVLAGADPLVERVRPNAAGIVTLPDGDFEYAFTVEGRHLEVLDPHWNNASGFFTAYLSEPERIVRIHRHKRYAVSLQVMVGDHAAAGVELSGSLVACGCGDCSGPAGTLSASGRIAIPDFYPEETTVCLVDDSDHLLWALQPQPARQTVQLPTGTTFMRSYCSGR